MEQGREKIRWGVESLGKTWRDVGTGSSACVLALRREAINGIGAISESPVDGKGIVAGSRYKVPCRFGSSCSVVVSSGYLW